jgi:hypothetical protein
VGWGNLPLGTTIYGTDSSAAARGRVPGSGSAALDGAANSTAAALAAMQLPGGSQASKATAQAHSHGQHLQAGGHAQQQAAAGVGGGGQAGASMLFASGGLGGAGAAPPGSVRRDLAPRYLYMPMYIWVLCLYDLPHRHANPSEA